MSIMKHLDMCKEGGAKNMATINQRIKGGRIVNILRTGGILDNPQGLRGINYVLLDGEIFWNK